MRPLCRPANRVLLAALATALVMTATAVSADPPTDPSAARPLAVTQGITLPLVANHHVVAPLVQSRFGVGAPQPYGIDEYSLADLGGSWYWDWGARPDAPREPGVDYYPTIRLGQVWVDGRRTDDYTHSPDATTISVVAQAHPGAVWFVGNEPDRVYWQDDLEPHVYARAYHDLYALIKSADPTALVAAGQIVQPTPLRLQYLDGVLDAYRSRYGVEMPVDVWAIHAYPLREDAYGWGAGIPPGIDATLGLDIEHADVIDVELFRGFLFDFRRWMADNGYRDCPLIISEFGILIPEDYTGMDLAHVLPYMTATFDLLVNSRDTETGMPADDNRLVQRWAWFKLVRPAQATWEDALAGDLYDGATGRRLPAGDHYAALAAAQPIYVNLRVATVEVEHLQPAGYGEPADLRLTAAVLNNGTVATPRPVRVRFYAGNPAEGGTPIGADQFVRALPGAAIPRSASVVWVDPPSGSHTVYAVVDPQDEVAETTTADNVGTAAVYVP